jgi:four helix bundle protein
MTTDDLKARTKRFALRVMTLVEVLPKSVRRRVIANQIMRSTSSVGANYRAASRACSRAEFISKIAPLLEEANELVAIMAASRKSALANRHLAIR